MELVVKGTQVEQGATITMQVVVVVVPQAVELTPHRAAWEEQEDLVLPSISEVGPTGRPVEVVEQACTAAEQAVLLGVELVLTVIETAVMPGHGEAVVVLEVITEAQTGGEAMVSAERSL
jgi:hypothetical protein